MKIGILISTNDPETLWNVFRFANLCLKDLYKMVVTSDRLICF